MKDYYFQKLGMTMDTNSVNGATKDTKVEVLGSYKDLPKHTRKTTNTTETSINSSNSSSSSSSSSDSSSSSSNNNNNNNNNTSIKTQDSLTIKNNNNNNPYLNSLYATSMCSSLSGSGADHKPGKNALDILNSQFITFNLQNDRLKKKTQLLKENHYLGNELKKVQTKNFTLSEELSKLKQEFPYSIENVRSFQCCIIRKIGESWF